VTAGEPTPRRVFRITLDEWRALPDAARVEEDGHYFARLRFIGEYAGDPVRGEERLVPVRLVDAPERGEVWMCQRCAVILRLGDDVPPPNACFACGGELGRVEPSTERAD
jgi:hypothetical protein